HGVHHLTEILLAGQRDDRRERLPERAVTLLCGAGDGCVEGLPSHVRLAALVEHLKMRCDLGLEREALQQALAEAVDGVDLQPAPRFERTGEEAPRGA